VARVIRLGEPRQRAASFEGRGLGFGVSRGPLTRIFSGGVDVALDDEIAAKGVCISGAIGLGVLCVEVSAVVMHERKLCSTP